MKRGSLRGGGARWGWIRGRGGGIIGLGEGIGLMGERRMGRDRMGGLGLEEGCDGRRGDHGGRGAPRGGKRENGQGMGKEGEKYEVAGRVVV